MYENTNYRNDIKKRQIVTLKILKSDLTNNSFNLTLHEPLIIDKISDIYLDSFISYKIGGSNKNTLDDKEYFILTIDEFNLQSVSNESSLYNKYIIPNDDSEGTGIKVHKSKKFNYVSTITPQKYMNLSGTITDKNGATIVAEVDGYFIAEFVIINRD